MSRKMKILVLYYSGTGNTRFACDVARAVMEKAGHEVTMRTYQKAGAVQYDDFDAFCFAAPEDRLPGSSRRRSRRRGSRLWETTTSSVRTRGAGPGVGRTLLTRRFPPWNRCVSWPLLSRRCF